MSSEREPRPEPLTIEIVAERACKVALKFGNHIPTIIAQGRGEPYMIQLPKLPDTHEGRVQAMRLSGFVLGESGTLDSDLQRVFFISEAWMSTPDKEQDDFPLPSQDPNRIEALVISQLNVSNNLAKLMIYQMLRYQDDTLDLQRMAMGDSDSAEVRSYLLEAFVEGYMMATDP